MNMLKVDSSRNNMLKIDAQGTNVCIFFLLQGLMDII